MNWQNANGDIYYIRKDSHSWRIFRQTAKGAKLYVKKKHFEREEAEEHLRDMAGIKGWIATDEEPKPRAFSRAKPPPGSCRHLGELRKQAVAWYAEIEPHLPGGYKRIGRKLNWKKDIVIHRVNACFEFNFLHIASGAGLSAIFDRGGID